MRTEEKFTLDVLVKHLGGPQKAVGCEGEDPPDAYIKIGEKKFALEITRLTPITFDEMGETHNRISEDDVAFNIIKELNTTLSSLVPANKALLLFITTPINSIKKFKKSLTLWLKNKMPSLDQKQNVTIESNLICAQFVSQKGRTKKIVGIVVNKNSNPNISLNAQTVLIERILNKEQKCKNIIEERWLALINNTDLINAEDYKKILHNKNIKHGFSKIFIISTKETVAQIFGSKE